MKVRLIIVTAALAGAAACGGGGASSPAAAPVQSPPAAGSTRTSAASSIPASKQHFQIVDSGYTTVSQDFGGGDGGPQFVEYAALIKNPNRTYYCALPEYRITAFGKHHRVLGTDTQVLDELPPLTTVAFAGQIDASARPTKVKLGYVKQTCQATVTKPQDYVPFKTTSVHLNAGGFSASVTGTLHNPYAARFGSMALTALYYKGSKLVSGDTTFVDHLSPHSSQPFEIDAENAPRGVTKTVVEAQPWDFKSTPPWNHAVYKAEGHG